MSVIIEMSSNLLHVSQPDTYGRQEEMNDRETRENEDYQEYSLKGNPDAKDGYFDLNSKKYLEKYLARGWFDTFDEVLKYTKKRTGIGIKLIRKGCGSPREYNFGTDWCSFDLQLSEANLKRIARIVFKHKDIFEKYCYEYHKSYDGFASFMPYHSLEEWQECFAQGKGVQWERAVWMLFEFFLWAYPFENNSSPSLTELEQNLNAFDEAYEGNLQDLDGNGVISDCFDFVPGNYAELLTERN